MIKRVYLLTFSDSLCDRNRMASVLDSVEEVLDWRSEFSNCFFVLTEQSADWLANKLTTTLGKNGLYFLTELAPNRQGLLESGTWKMVDRSTDYLVLPARKLDDDLSERAKIEASPLLFKDRTSGLISSIESEYCRIRDNYLGWPETLGSARKWWEAFEQENAHRMPLVLKLAEELALRKATVTEFFLAYVYSNVDNIQGNLHYLDFARLKKAEEERKKAEARIKEVVVPKESESLIPQITAGV